MKLLRQFLETTTGAVMLRHVVVIDEIPGSSLFEIVTVQGHRRQCSIKQLATALHPTNEKSAPAGAQSTQL